MTMHLPRRPEIAGATRVFTRQQVEDLCLSVEAEMEALVDLVVEETALVRAGKLFAAGELQDRKTECARTFIANFEMVQRQRAEIERAAPGLIERLRRRHEEFRLLLQVNLAVLAAAREVSESLIGSIATGVGKPVAPTAYGRGGDMQGGQIAARGLAVDAAY